MASPQVKAGGTSSDDRSLLNRSSAADASPSNDSLFPAPSGSPEKSAVAATVRSALLEVRRCREQGRLGQARKILSETLARLDSVSDFQLDLAEEMVLCGEFVPARSLLDALSADPLADPVRRTWAVFIDELFRWGRSGPNLLPPALQSSFDRVLQAFEAVSGGDDESAITLMHDISRNSPLAEWKLFLRGLSAYYQHDDERALSNWARLDPNRLPAQWAAPFRSQIDAEFLAQLPVAAQRKLAEQARLLNDDPLGDGLRSLHDRLQRSRQGLGAAWSIIRKLLPVLNQRKPAWVRRLKQIMYWEIVERGRSDDLLSFEELFGPSEDDPQFDRLNALVSERTSFPWLSASYWERYLSQLNRIPGLMPAERRRLEAMVCLRLGKARLRLARLHAVGGSAGSKKPSSGGHSTEDRCDFSRCFAQAVSVDPHWLEGHRARVLSLALSGRHAEALIALEEMLQQFPNDVEALCQAARWYQRLGNDTQAINYWHRALQQDPLHRRAREEWTLAQWRRAARLASEKLVDSAVAMLQEAARFPTDHLAPFHRASRTVAERHLRRDAREIAMSRDTVSSPERVICHGWIWFWAHLLKWPVSWRRPLREEGHRILSDPEPGTGDLLGMARYWRVVQALGVTYRGQKKDYEKARDFLKRRASELTNEPAILELGTELLRLREPSLVSELTEQWRTSLPHAVVPLILRLETAPGGRRRRGQKLQELWTEARQRLQQMPPSPFRDELQRRLEKCLGAPGSGRRDDFRFDDLELGAVEDRT